MRKSTLPSTALILLGLTACAGDPVAETSSSVAPPSAPAAASMDPSEQSATEEASPPTTGGSGPGTVDSSSPVPPAPDEAAGGGVGVQNPPAEEPVGTPPAGTPPAGTPPAESPPAETPPAETPPAVEPGAGGAEGVPPAGMEPGGGGMASVPGEVEAGGQTGTAGQSGMMEPAAGGAPSEPEPSSGGASGMGNEPASGGAAPMDDCVSTDAAENFSFFVTSMFHILELSGSEDGFGGDLRYNGAQTGLEGADAICQEMARRVCHGHKTWRAFLSTSQVDGIDRIGAGPWYDHAGILVAEDVSGLAGQERPAGGCCDVGTYDELGLLHDGVNNGDDHDTLTGSDREGRLDTGSSTCDDWTSTSASGRPRIGHSWPRSPRNGRQWLMDHNAGGCAAGINTGRATNQGSAVGSGGGYGGFYCFAE